MEASMAFAGIDRLRFPGVELMKWLRANTNLTWTGFYFPVGGEEEAKLSWHGQFNLLKSQGWGVAPLYVGKQVYTEKEKAKIREDDRKRSKPPRKFLSDDPLWSDLEGAKDGLQAAEFARDEGIPKDTVIYLDVEMPGLRPLPDYFASYQAEWAKSVKQEGFRPGIYCSWMNAKAHIEALDKSLNKKVSWAAVWVAGPLPYGTFTEARKHLIPRLPVDPPKKSGFAEATSWQFGHGCALGHIVVNRKGKLPFPEFSAILPNVDLDSSIHRDPGNPS